MVRCAWFPPLRTREIIPLHTAFASERIASPHVRVEEAMNGINSPCVREDEVMNGFTSPRAEVGSIRLQPFQNAELG